MDLTPEQIARHNAAYNEGRRLTQDGLILNEFGPRVPKAGWFLRRKLLRAIHCFEQAIEIKPDNWNAMWIMGKVYHRLDDREKSLHWFREAYQINPKQPDVAREAGIAALDLGEGSLGLKFCIAAVELKPNDPGLIANLALAYLISGDVKKAQESARYAVTCHPDDITSRNVLKLVEAVHSGARRIPNSLRDL